MASVKKNFGFNLVLSLCNYIFPLITYPYVSRILGVTNIGVCSYVDSIITYFMLFSMLGVASVGVREIAKCRSDQQEINRLTSGLIFINLSLTLLAILILIILTFSVSLFHPYKEFLLVGIVKLFFNVFLIEWFFQGLQNFKYITIRSVVIRIIYVVAIFVFVKSKEDTICYYALTSGTVVINALCNWIYAHRFFSFTLCSLRLRDLIFFVASFGYYKILTSLYTTFNVFFLGTVSGSEEVGYFSTATKLNGIIMAVFTAFTTVMVPHVAQLMKNGDQKELQLIASRSFSLISRSSLPIIAWCIANAPLVIKIIAGPGYEGAIIPFRLIIVLILVIGIEQVAIQQFLMASSNSSKPVIKLSTIGAVVGLTINFCITPFLSSIGSAIAWGLSESVVLVFGLYYLKRTMGISYGITNYKSLIYHVLIYSITIIPIVLFVSDQIKIALYSSICVLILFVIQDKDIVLMFSKRKQI